MGLSNGELNTLALNNNLTGLHFKGVYAQNALPCPIAFAKNKRSFAIINTENFENEGHHWTLLYSDEYCVHYFCPLAQEPRPNVLNFLTATGSFTVNALKLQADSSHLCGQFCLVFALLRLNGYTNNEVCKLFSARTLEKNDLVVLQIFQEHFNT